MATYKFFEDPELNDTPVGIILFYVLIYLFYFIIHISGTCWTSVGPVAVTLRGDIGFFNAQGSSLLPTTIFRGHNKGI